MARQIQQAWAVMNNNTGITFQSTDVLWQSFQLGIKEYVNSSSDRVSVNDPETLRPNWNQVQRVFDGLADEETIGCE